jgi:hypothetical protein
MPSSSMHFNMTTVATLAGGSRQQGTWEKVHASSCRWRRRTNCVLRTSLTYGPVDDATRIRFPGLNRPFRLESHLLKAVYPWAGKSSQGWRLV